jgi:2-dehydro-3-deoxygalactonokinase
MPDIIALNWGSTNLRAFRLAENGTVRDSVSLDRGILRTDKAGIETTVAEIVTRWPGCDAILASGMIGSAAGWTMVPYCPAPTSASKLMAHAMRVDIGGHEVILVPGVSGLQPDGRTPDVMRGEEVELIGIADIATKSGRQHVLLPGTHSKWVALEDGGIVGFVTAMSGELFDRVTEKGLLSGLLNGPAELNAAFDDGFDEGFAGTRSLTTALFSIRASVMHDVLPREDVSSRLRGLLIGAEIGDGVSSFPEFGKHDVPIMVGHTEVLRFYTHALARVGVQTRAIDAQAAAPRGFSELWKAATCLVQS